MLHCRTKFGILPFTLIVTGSHQARYGKNENPVEMNNPILWCVSLLLFMNLKNNFAIFPSSIFQIFERFKRVGIKIIFFYINEIIHELLFAFLPLRHSQNILQLEKN